MSDQVTPDEQNKLYLSNEQKKFYWQLLELIGMPVKEAEYCERYLSEESELTCSRGTLGCYKKHPEDAVALMPAKPRPKLTTPNAGHTGSRMVGCTGCEKTWPISYATHCDSCGSLLMECWI